MLENFAGLKDVKVGVVRRAWSWLGSELIQDVPEESALCEFDCRKPQCTYKEWSSCRRRLERAAGELMPAPNPQSGLNSRVGSLTGLPFRPSGDANSRCVD
jgi:hypothetical protein